MKVESTMEHEVAALPEHGSQSSKSMPNSSGNTAGMDEERRAFVFHLRELNQAAGWVGGAQVDICGVGASLQEGREVRTDLVDGDGHGGSL